MKIGVPKTMCRNTCMHQLKKTNPQNYLDTIVIYNCIKITFLESFINAYMCSGNIMRKNANKLKELTAEA